MSSTKRRKYESSPCSQKRSKAHKINNKLNSRNFERQTSSQASHVNVVRNLRSDLQWRGRSRRQRSGATSFSSPCRMKARYVTILSKNHRVCAKRHRRNFASRREIQVNAKTTVRCFSCPRPIAPPCGFGTGRSALPADQLYRVPPPSLNDECRALEGLVNRNKSIGQANTFRLGNL